VHVPAADDLTTQVRFLDDVDRQARHAIALVRGVPEDSFDIEIEVVDDKVTP
jgi:hypothetical protein